MPHDIRFGIIYHYMFFDLQNKKNLIQGPKINHKNSGKLARNSQAITSNSLTVLTTKQCKMNNYRIGP